MKRALSILFRINDLNRQVFVNYYTIIYYTSCEFHLLIKIFFNYNFSKKFQIRRF